MKEDEERKNIRQIKSKEKSKYAVWREKKKMSKMIWEGGNLENIWNEWKRNRRNWDGW